MDPADRTARRSRLVVRWRELGRVLAEAYPVWLALGGVAAAVLLDWITVRWAGAPFETGVRVGALALQLFGLALVAVGLSQTRRHFGRPSLAQNARTWLRSLAAAFEEGNVTLAGSAALRASAAAVLATGSVKLRDGASLEERLQRVERQLDLLEREQGAFRTQVRKELDVLRAELKTEAAARAQQHAALQHALEDFAVGGLHLEFVGMVWLVVGTVASSLPGEIAAVLYG